MHPGASARVLAGVAAWLLVALVAGAGGVLGALPPPFPQAVLAGLTLAVLVACWASRALRDVVLSIDIRVLILVHLTRFVGAYFLVLYGRGELPYDFAVPGGLGDIAVATLALAVAWAAPRRGRAGRWMIGGWNLLGLVDILFVVATASRLGLADPASMRALTHLPLSLLPSFLVPIIIASHIIIFARLLRPPGQSGAAC